MHAARVFWRESQQKLHSTELVTTAAYLWSPMQQPRTAAALQLLAWLKQTQITAQTVPSVQWSASALPEGTSWPGFKIDLVGRAE